MFFKGFERSQKLFPKVNSSDGGPCLVSKIAPN